MKRMKQTAAIFLAAGMIFSVSAGAKPPDYSGAGEAQETSISGDVAISPRADKIVWKYKTINGAYYRRQYNIANGKWIGEWELC